MNHSNNTDLNRHYHFIGIGGIGMSALAIFYLQQGFNWSFDKKDKIHQI